MRYSEPYTIFPRSLKSGKTVYYYQFRKDDGTRSVAKSTGCDTLAKAKRYCNQLYNNGEFDKHSTVNFAVYTKEFFTEKSRYYKWKIANKEHISQETLLAYNKFLRNQLLPYFENYLITNIKRATVKEWVIWATEKWSAKTVNSAQTVLNIIFKQAIDDEILEVNPCYNISFRDVNKKNRDLLTLEEVKDIYNSPKWWNDNQTVFLLDVITGMRISEVVALTKDCIFDNYVKVKKSYSRKFGMGATKTNLNRCVPVPLDLCNKLKQSDNDFIFITHKGDKKGKPLNIGSFYINLCEIYQSLNIDYKARNLDVHTNRNFYISYLQSENVPEPKIRAVVGHKDKSMTDLYTYWKTEMFQEVYIAQKKLYDFIVKG